MTGAKVCLLEYFALRQRLTTIVSSSTVVWLEALAHQLMASMLVRSLRHRLTALSFYSYAWGVHTQRQRLTEISMHGC